MDNHLPEILAVVFCILAFLLLVQQRFMLHEGWFNLRQVVNHESAFFVMISRDSNRSFVKFVIPKLIVIFFLGWIS